MLNRIIDSIKIYHSVTLVTLSGVDPDKLSRADIFTAIARRGINLDMISQTPHLGNCITISFSVPDEFLTGVLAALAEIKKNFGVVNTDVSSGHFIVSLHSSRMVDTPGVAAEVFTVFDRAKIPVLLITTSDMSISCLFAQSTEAGVLEALKVEGLATC